MACPFDVRQVTTYSSCPNAASQTGCYTCATLQNQLCRKVPDGTNSECYVKDLGINNTFGFCPFPQTSASLPCETARCGDNQVCVNLPKLGGGFTAFCSDVCATKNCPILNTCNVTVTNGVPSATCLGCNPTPSCAAPPAGCQYVRNPLAPCSCGFLKCGCPNKCGRYETCKTTFTGTSVTNPATCVCIPGTSKSPCDGLDYRPAMGAPCTCNIQGGWDCPANPTCAPTCQEPKCVAPNGCFIVRNNVVAASDECLTCKKHFQVRCPLDACGTNCSSIANICVKPPNFDLSTGTIADQIINPICGCVPGASRVLGCKKFTCNSAGTGFTVSNSGTCCTSGAVVNGFCGNTCQCKDGVFQCTRIKCSCVEGAIRYKGCRRGTCTNGAWVYEDKLCEFNKCFNSTTGAEISRYVSDDLCFAGACVNITGASGDTVTRWTIQATPQTCQADATSGRACYRLVFSDVDAFDEREFRLRTSINGRLASLSIHIDDETVVVTVCVKTTTTRSNDVCTDSSDASSCEEILSRSSTGAATMLVSSMTLLAAMLFLALLMM